MQGFLRFSSTFLFSESRPLPAFVAFHLSQSVKTIKQKEEVDIMGLSTAVHCLYGLDKAKTDVILHTTSCSADVMMPQSALR